MDKNDKKILSGALILGMAAVVSKLLGAIYRIPLTKIIGGTGLGLYQMVFPVYTLLLDFSGASVPNAVAKIISSYNGVDKEEYARKILKTSLLFFSLLGALFAAITAVFSDNIAVAQGNADASLAYVFLSPAVFFVCLICCFRGYFQGFVIMSYTAVSQITEQFVKLAAGLSVASFFMSDIKKAVAGATFAITLSEFVSLVFMVIVYVMHKKKRGYLSVALDKKTFTLSLKKIFFYAVPITLTGVTIPLSKVIDSFLIVNLMSGRVENPTALYGLFSGVAATVVGLPVAVCYGISAVVIPVISSVKPEDKNKNALKAILLTAAVSVPCTIFCALFAPLIIRVLFGYLGETEKAVSVNLLRLCSPCVALLSILQTVNGVLIGKDSPVKPIVGMMFGVAIKTVIEIFTLSDPRIGVYGAGVGAIACYFVANLVNLSMVFSVRRKRKGYGSSHVKIGRYADN
ncbi:MAG: polysaccharide biosynthesis protein [Clostridia bacterium]|nr:polysaccharide biosynthesis protein [Clostridia bacterium]